MIPARPQLLRGMITDTRIWHCFKSGFRIPPSCAESEPGVCVDAVTLLTLSAADSGMPPVGCFQVTDPPFQTAAFRFPLPSDVRQIDVFWGRCNIQLFPQFVQELCLVRSVKRRGIDFLQRMFMLIDDHFNLAESNFTTVSQLGRNPLWTPVVDDILPIHGRCPAKEPAV